MERKALESVGAQYGALRGLFGVPLGIVIICCGLGNLAWGPFEHLWVFWVVVGLAGIGFLWATHHYRQHYGRVSPSRRDQIKIAVATAFGAALMWGAITLDWRGDLPINATAAAFALLFLVSYGIVVGVRRHHALIWGAVLVAGLAPLWGDVSRDTKINVGMILVGVCTIPSGLLDHLALRRAFAQPTGLDLEDGNAPA